jgi:hypothetical protein
MGPAPDRDRYRWPSTDASARLARRQVTAGHSPPNERSAPQHLAFRGSFTFKAEVDDEARRVMFRHLAA